MNVVPFKVLAVMIAPLFLAGVAAPQQEPPKKSEPAAQERQAEGTRTAGAGVLPSAALRLGADLEAAAPGPFLKWARKFAKREIVNRSQPPTQEAVVQGLHAAFPKAPATAHRAGEILTWYLAYQESAKALEIAASRVRDLEKDLGYINDDLLRHRSTPVPIQQAAAAREVEDRIIAILEQTTHQRNLHKQVENLIRTRVDLCIERLAALSTTLKDRDPAIIRGLK